MKKILTLILAFIVIGSLFALPGCKDKDDGNNSNGSKEEGKMIAGRAMMITDKEVMETILQNDRRWLGIASMERTRGGRIYASYHTGGTKEGATGPEIENTTYIVLTKSDDDGNTWDNVALAVGIIEDEVMGDRYSPALNAILWTDPDGRLWFGFTPDFYGDFISYASVCEFPDRQTPVFSALREIGEGAVCSNPLVTSDGRWLFSTYVPDYLSSFSNYWGNLVLVYESTDKGENFRVIGKADSGHRPDFAQEPMLIEKEDGTLDMYMRVNAGIAKSQSFDGGKTWTVGVLYFPGPSTRFFIQKLSSGRLLLVYHWQSTGRSHLTAMLSEDEGATWLDSKLLLDERRYVSYPDASVGEDGNIYVVYDRERGALNHEVPGGAREVLIAKFTETDILQGRLVTSGSFTKKVIQKATGNGVL